MPHNFIKILIFIDQNHIIKGMTFLPFFFFFFK